MDSPGSLFPKSSPVSDTKSSLSTQRHHLKPPVKRLALFNRKGSVPLNRVGSTTEGQFACNVKKRNQSSTDFGDLTFVQDLSFYRECGGRRIQSGIWTAEFSIDGHYLAAGGQSKILYVWKLRDRVEECFLVFDQEPVSECWGHENDILDISWFRNNHVLSCSLDRTVRLWNFLAKECIRLFRHGDCVTSISCHPTDDRFFVSGSIDSQLRLWNLEEPDCVVSRYIPDTLITSVGFAKEGQTVMVGSYKGKCFFFDAEGLRYNTQIPIRMKSRLKKITNIEMVPLDNAVFVSSNDSKIHIFNLRDKIQTAILQGFSNRSSLIKARCSEDGDYFISGSEDRKICIWKSSPQRTRPSQQGFFGRLARKLQRQGSDDSFEYFVGHEASVTVAMFAPFSVKNHVKTLLNKNSLGPSGGMVIVSGDTEGHLKVWINHRL